MARTNIASAVITLVFVLIVFGGLAVSKPAAAADLAASTGDSGGAGENWIWSHMVDYDDPGLQTGHAHAGGPGSYGVFTFTGSGIDVYGVACPIVTVDQKTHRTGKVKISIDGKVQSVISLASADVDFHHKIISIAGLSNGNHALEVEPLEGWVIINSVNVQTGASTSSAPVAAAHLLAYWPLDDGQGLQAQDKSGHGHTAYLMAGASWTSDHKTGCAAAIAFPTAGGVEASDPIINTSRSYSVSAWIKLTEINGALQTFVSLDANTVSGFYLQLRSTKMFAFTTFHGDDTSQFVFAGANFIPQTGVWYNLVGVYNSQAHMMALYVNGQLQGTQSFDGWSALGHFVIGRGKWGGKYVDFSTAEINDVRAYNIALQPSEILNLYSNGR